MEDDPQSGMETTENVKGKGKLAYFSLSFFYVLLGGVVSSFLLYYFTDVALLPIGAVSILLFVVRAFDGLIDPMIGYYMDSRVTGGDRYIGYLRKWTLPYCLLSLFLFMRAPMTGMAGKIIWFAVLFALWSLANSVVEGASLPLMVVMSTDGPTRRTLNSCKIVAGVIATLVARFLTLELARRMGDGDEQRGFSLVMAVFAALAIAGMLVPVCLIREQSRVGANHLSLSQTAVTLLRDRRILFMLLFYLCAQMASATKGQAAIYFMKYIIDRPDITSIFLLTGVVGSLLAQPFIFLLCRYISYRKLIVAGFLGAAAAVALMNFAGANALLLLAANGLCGLMVAFPANLVFLYAADLADAHKGERSATIFSMLGLSSRLGAAVASGLIGAILYVSNYAPNTELVESAQGGIRIAFVAVTLMLYSLAAGFAAFSFRNNLHEGA